MGFLGDIAKGVGRELKLGARVGISSMAQGIKTNVKRPTSVDKANPYGIFKYPPGSKVPKAGIRAQGTWRELQKNTKPPVPQADISIFGGKAFVTKEKRMEWLKKHKNEIYQITRGRVTERKLAEFDKEIFQKDIKQGGIVTRKEVMRDISGTVPDLEKKRFYQAETSPEKEDIREDAKVARKMLGLDQKK